MWIRHVWLLLLLLLWCWTKQHPTICTLPNKSKLVQLHIVLSSEAKMTYVIFLILAFRDLGNRTIYLFGSQKMLLGSKWLFYVHPDGIQRVENVKCGGILAKEHVQKWAKSLCRNRLCEWQGRERALKMGIKLQLRFPQSLLTFPIPVHHFLDFMIYWEFQGIWLLYLGGSKAAWSHKPFYILQSTFLTQCKGHFTHKPRAVTMKLWETKRKCVKAVSTHLASKIM
jgi:hypothetical protein